MSNPALWARFIAHAARTGADMLQLRKAMITMCCHYEGSFGYERPAPLSAGFILCLRCGQLHYNYHSLAVSVVAHCGSCGCSNSHARLTAYVVQVLDKHPHLLEHLQSAYCK